MENKRIKKTRGYQDAQKEKRSAGLHPASSRTAPWARGAAEGHGARLRRHET